MLQNDSGQWIKDNAQLQSLVNEYYKNIFALRNNWGSWKQTIITFPSLDNAVIQSLMST